MQKKRKTHILVECIAPIPSVRVGVLEPLKWHQQNENCDLRFLETMSITKEDLVWADVLISVRGCEASSLCVVKAAKEAGRLVIYFLDDDLLSIPMGNDSSQYFAESTTKDNIIQLLKLSDVLWCVNQKVAAKYSSYVGGKAVVSDIPCNISKRPKAIGDLNEQTNILYAGSIDHLAVIQEYLVPAIEKVSMEKKGKVEFTFIGPDPNLSHLPNVHHYEFFEDYDEYKNFVHSQSFQIGLAPIRVTDFYAAKYYNKFIEYGSMGIAGIYTEADPYEMVVRDGQNGWLCENTPQQWYEAILYAVEHPEQVYACAVKVQEMLGERFSYERIGSVLEEKLPELFSYQAVSINNTAVRLPNMKMMFYKEKLRLYVRIYGWQTLPMIGRKIFKKISKRG